MYHLSFDCHFVEFSFYATKKKGENRFVWWNKFRRWFGRFVSCKYIACIFIFLKFYLRSNMYSIALLSVSSETPESTQKKKTTGKNCLYKINGCSDVRSLIVPWVLTEEKCALCSGSEFHLNWKYSFIYMPFILDNALKIGRFSSTNRIMTLGSEMSVECGYRILHSSQCSCSYDMRKWSPNYHLC